MASSPAGRRNLYTNNKDYPGCMGGLMHLFDFNQALSGRKLLTDKKSGAGIGLPRNSLDVAGNNPEVSNAHAERSDEIPYGYELHKASTSRRISGMPIKALIAEELLKDGDSKNRSPSVVARLMGLEALPTNSKALQKLPTGSILGKVDEKFKQRPMVERHRHDENPPHSVKLYAKKAKASAISGQITPKSFRPQQTESQDRKQGSESPGLRSHPQEQQLQEFKKEFEAWQTQKSSANSKRSSRLDDRQVQMPRQQSLPREDLKRAVFQDKIPGQNVNIAEERLHESREFQDALDFLQSNKEFFMRFLHEPNSLFARHLQDNEAESPLELPKGAYQRRPQQVGNTSESPRPPSNARESPLSRRYESIGSREDSRHLSWYQDSPISKSPGGSLLTEKGKPSTPLSPMGNSEASLRLHDQRNYPFSPMASQNNLDCHVPTRIVVLKPSPGRVRNSKSTSPAYLRSPKDHIAYETLREGNTDVLEKLREKLRKDNSGEYSKSERNNGVLRLNEQYRDSAKDPREIAREIARQVRENITRDLMPDSVYLHSTARKKSVGRRATHVEDCQDGTHIDGDLLELTSRAQWDSYARSSLASAQPERTFDLEAKRSSVDQKADMIELVKKRVSDSSTSYGHNVRMKNFVRDRDRLRQSSAGLKPSSNSKGSGQLTVDGSTVSQPYVGSLGHGSAVQIENSLREDLVFDSEHCDHVDLIKTSFPESLPDLESDEAKNVPELQMGEGAVGSDCVVSIEVTDVEGPKVVDADLTNLAASDASLDEADNSATLEMKYTSVMMEEHSGSQLSEEMAVTSLERKQQSDGDGLHFSHELPVALYSNPSVDSQVSTIAADDFSKVDGSQASDSKLELVEESEGQEMDLCNNEQTLEVYENDCHAPLDSTPVHASTESLSTTDQSNFIMKPVKEQPEQPSPVSVLDLPFQDESSVSTEFKELSSDLEELRLRLRLLNFDNGNHDLDNDDNLESELDSGSHSEEVLIVEDCRLDHTQTDKDGFLGGACCNVADWRGENLEMCYVRDILAASGFTGDSSSVLTQWYAPGQPLNPRLFQNLDKRFSKELVAQELAQDTSESSTQEGVLNASRRRLLFDSANEVLLDVLGPYMNRRVWLLSSKVAPCMPTGEDLVELVWTQLWRSLCTHTGSQETLENLVTDDLGKGSQWLNVGVEIEAAGFDVERAILDDLIEETLLVL